MGAGRSERILTLARQWPKAEALDLAYATFGAVCGRHNAEGYDPMVPMRHRVAFDGMSPGGTLPGAFFRSDPIRLEALGIRWVQVPAAALSAQAGQAGVGETLDMPLEAGRPRFIPFPFVLATEIRVASWMSDAVGLAQGVPVARLLVRLVSGHVLELELRAGKDTGEWAYDRPDVRAAVAHDRPQILESWRDPAGFEGHRYVTTLALPGRYAVEGLDLERLPGAGRLTISRLGALDGATGRVSPVSIVAAYVSDTGHIKQIAATPAVRLFEVPGSLGAARVVERLRRLPDGDAVRRGLRAPAADFDPRREALAVDSEAAGVTLPPGSRASRAEAQGPLAGRIDVQAEGPGLLVVAESWDPGWRATVDEKEAAIVRVNQIQMGIVLKGGIHRVALRHHDRGFLPGAAVAGLVALGLAALARPDAAA
jgi:hypothetical protein